jgi:hypothetical protein
VLGTYYRMLPQTILQAKEPVSLNYLRLELQSHKTWTGTGKHKLMSLKLAKTKEIDKGSDPDQTTKKIKLFKLSKEIRITNKNKEKMFRVRKILPYG